MNSLARRDFFSLLATIALPVGSARARALLFRAKTRLVVTIVGDSSRAAVARGAVMGVEEAKHAAAMFDADVELRTGRDQRSVKRVDDGVQVVIDTRGLGREPNGSAAAAAANGALFLNVIDENDAFRAACQRHVVHIAAPASMQRATGAGAGEDVVGWHPSLTRFGADTLNKRYRASEGAGMDEQAWAGWFAVKCAWEGTLKSKSSTAAGLMEYLERPTTRFDGHKGEALYFDARHQLVQPLYVVRGGTVVREAIPEVEDKPACTWK